jgi:hypothetical protein
MVFPSSQSPVPSPQEKSHECPIKSYRDLEVCQSAMALARNVYRVTVSFPAEERFGLVSQMRRAAVSIPSNVAEGHARQGTREYLHF